MDATVWIALWAFSFLASHLIISSSAVRARLIGAVGEQPYRGIYSLVAAATLGPLIYEFARNKHAGRCCGTCVPTRRFDGWRGC
jgi:uncharacterized membrane protein